MKKDDLKYYLICDLYQVNQTQGYFKLDDLRNACALPKYGVSEISCCNKIGHVILKKNRFSLSPTYRLCEAITNVPLDIIYGRYDSMYGILHLKGKKREYHTFALIMESETYSVKLKDFQKYFIEEHPNQEEYRKMLFDLIQRGNDNLALKKQKESEDLNHSNSIVRSLRFKNK